MKILVQSPRHNPVCLNIPTGLLLNSVSGSILSLTLRKHGVPISGQQLSALIQAIHSYRRSHPEWVLVEAWDADGSYTSVSL